jgi:mRNA-degrading endonuclease toxin of MazEF toxin-antitoxin module
MKINLWIIVTSLKNKLLSKDYELNLKSKFIENITKKSSWLENNINWFINKLKISSNINEKKNIIFYKWSIYYIDFWINIWSEINWTRPALIYKNWYFTQWKDIIVIPFTSLEDEKLIDKFDIIIKKWSDNNLDNDSVLKIRQLKVISKKRLGEFKWFMNNKENRFKINKKVIKMLWLK